MTSTKMDRRTERTRRALRSAFLELVFADGYAQVTVGDIIERANVGRSTFYLHYAGKEALLKETLERPCSRLAACVGGEITADALTPLLDHFREQWSLNRVFFEPPVRALFVQSLAALLERKLLRYKSGRSAGAAQALLPRPLMALLLAEMQVALINHWLAGVSPVEPPRLAQALLVSTQGLLEARRFIP